MICGGGPFSLLEADIGLLLIPLRWSQGAVITRRQMTIYSSLNHTSTRIRFSVVSKLTDEILYYSLKLCSCIELLLHLRLPSYSIVGSLIELLISGIWLMHVTNNCLNRILSHVQFLSRTTFIRLTNLYSLGSRCSTTTVNVFLQPVTASMIFSPSLSKRICIISAIRSVTSRCAEPLTTCPCFLCNYWQGLLLDSSSVSRRLHLLWWWC